MFRNRLYRDSIRIDQNTFFEVTVKETNLWIQAPRDFESIARELVFQSRGYIEAFIERHPDFINTLHPWHEQ